MRLYADQICKTREQLTPVCWTRQKGDGWKLKRETSAVSVLVKPEGPGPATLQWKRTSAGWKMFRVMEEGPAQLKQLKPASATPPPVQA